MTTTPLVTIIIVNFNGKDFLEKSLTSLSQLKYPRTKYEVIVVDNNSHDNSVSYIKRYFPQVKVIESTTNLGFAAGNNLGVKHAKGKYIAFLNSDTKVEKNWLAPLVSRIESNRKIGAVNSKLLWYYPYLPLTIISTTHAKSSFRGNLDFQEVGMIVEDVFLSDVAMQPGVRYYSGFADEKDKGIVTQRWTKEKATILIPINPDAPPSICVVTIRTHKEHSRLKTHLKLKLGHKKPIADSLDSYEVKQYTFQLNPKDLKPHLIYAIQNAGNCLFYTGHSRDRGASVGNNRHYYELASEYYERPCKIEAFCGASTLMKKSLFQKMGGFDETLFMYYEDIDLSLRLRRLGYTIFYEPKSVVYHVHTGTSQAWSPFFLYHTEKNHLAMCFTHTPLKIAWLNFYYF